MVSRSMNTVTRRAERDIMSIAMVVARQRTTNQVVVTRRVIFIDIEVKSTLNTHNEGHLRT